MNIKGRTEIISIAALPPTLNEIIDVARTHYRAAAAQKKKWTTLLATVFSKVEPFVGQVWLEYVWYIKNTRRDQDNVTAAQKFILDGAVLSDTLPDDSFHVIKSPVIHWIEKSTFDGFTIILRDETAFIERSKLGIVKPTFELLLQNLPLARKSSPPSTKSAFSIIRKKSTKTKRSKR